MQVNSGSERVKLLILSCVYPATHEIQQCSSTLGETFSFQGSCHDISQTCNGKDSTAVGHVPFPSHLEVSLV